MSLQCDAMFQLNWLFGGGELNTTKGNGRPEDQGLAPGIDDGLSSILAKNASSCLSFGTRVRARNIKKRGDKLEYSHLNPCVELVWKW